MEVKERARRYLEYVDPSVSGQGGHNTALRAAIILRDKFALSPEDALDAMKEWNQRCVPPWAEKDLRRKVYEAEKFYDKPSGELSSPQESRRRPRRRVAPSYHLSGSERFKQRNMDVFEGKFRGIKTGWPIFDRWIDPFIPGKISLCVAEPGAGKTLFAQQILVRCARQKIPFLYVPLEDDLEFYLDRFMAILTGKSWYTDYKRKAERKEEVIQDWKKYSKALDILAQQVYIPTEEATPELFFDIIEKNRKDKRLIIIDPITARKPDKPWISDHEAVVWSAWATEYSPCSTLLLTHPRKDYRAQKGCEDGIIRSMAQIAGGSSATRFVPYAFSLNKVSSQGSVLQYDDDGTVQRKRSDYNRVLCAVKSRNSAFQGREVALNLNPKTLKYDEVGGLE